MDNRITNSMYHTGQECAFKFLLQYVKGIRRDRAARPLRMGSAFHAAQERKDLEPDESIGEIVGHVMAEYEGDRPPVLTDEEQRDTDIEKAQIAALIVAHDSYYKNLDNSYEVLESEMTFELGLRNPDTGALMETPLDTVAGKLDKLVRLPDGRIMLQEFKTTMDDLGPDSDFWKRLAIDMQLSIYYLGAAARGFPAISGIIYDVARKQTTTTRPTKLSQKETAHLLETGEYMTKIDKVDTLICRCEVEKEQEVYEGVWTAMVDGEVVEIEPGKKPGTYRMTETMRMFQARLIYKLAADPTKYFVRKIIDRKKMQLDNAQRNLCGFAKIVEVMLESGIFPQNDRACTQMGCCEYLELCSSGFDPNNYERLPEGFKIVEDVHQELIKTEEKGP